jgi:hypothetical protein
VVSDTFDSILTDLAFPEPFVPEPYEPYDPYHPIPSNSPESELPQRVPAEPDVPEVAPDIDDPTAPLAESRELTRIARYLRTDGPTGADRPNGFDMAAVLEAVRSVPDVRDAQLRWAAGSGHTLRIEFRDGVDEGQVTRQVAVMLRETMGIEAQPTQPRAAGRRSSGRASVPSMAGLQHESGRPLPHAGAGGARVVLDHVQVTTLGLDATVEVRLNVSGGHGGRTVGKGHGPAVDAYLLRLAASAAGDAIDQLLTDADGVSTGRVYVEHVAVVPFAGVEVALVVLLLVCGNVAEQLSGSAVVAGDPRQAVVRATLSAANRRLESLLA